MTSPHAIYVPHGPDIIFKNWIARLGTLLMHFYILVVLLVEMYMPAVLGLRHGTIGW